MAALKNRATLKKWQDLQDTALYSSDLRVRAAAIEINLVVNNLAKTDETADRIMRSAESIPSNRPWAAWELGMLPIAGSSQNAFTNCWSPTSTNLSSRPDSGQSKGWLTSAPMKPSRILEVLRSDVSMDVRERAGCSLAKSGMLTREQRMKAVPGLIDLGDDTSLNETTRNWVYQALREITNQPLPNSSADWRSWYTNFGAVRQQEFRQGDSWSVLGNN